jgi:DNA-binding NarL/FixJ family response regulator
VVERERLCDDIHMALSVLIVDDHAAFRAAARKLLEADGLAVAGEAGDGAAALDQARRLRPDVVLLDIALPDASGFDLADALASAGLRVILVSSRQASDLGRRVAQSPALGFVPKDELSAARVRALLEAM